MLVSLCMIVKNEEKVLGRCLDSVQGLVDEIIIVDTGSQDRTKEIARQYTHHVYDFEWVNDFAAARNESLRYATSKWILVMDADEYVGPNQYVQLRKMLGKTSTSNPQCFLVKIMNFHGDRGEQIYESTGARLFTNHYGIRYEEPIHEQLVCPNGEIKFVLDSFTLFHSGYTTLMVKEKNKNQRNMEILQSMDSESKRKDPYFCFILGNEYANIDDSEQAYNYYRKSIEKADIDSIWYPHLLNNLCQHALRSGHYREAEQYIRQGLRLWPHQVDYYCLEGMLYETFGFYNKAEQSFKQCLTIAERDRSVGRSYWVIEESYGQSIPHKKLAEIAGKRADLHQQVYHLTAMLKLDRQNFGVLRALLRTLARHDTAANVQAFIQKIYPLSDSKNAFILLQVCLMDGLAELAAPYWEACHKLQVPIQYKDELAFGLLQRTGEATPKNNQRLEPQLALLSSIVRQDGLYAVLSETQHEEVDKLIRLLLEGAGTGTLSPEEYALLTQLIVQLLQYGYIDEYESLVNRFADEELLHRLAEQLNSLGYEEVAIELYSVLLDNNLLRGEGYKQLGLYCYRMNNPQNGLQFMEQAVQLTPSHDLIGVVLENGIGLDKSCFISSCLKWVDKDLLPDFLSSELL